MKLIKSIVYRFYSTFITALIAFIFTKNWKISFFVSFLDFFIKILSYYVFEYFWHKKINFKNKPTVIWFTGLSGAGKTTISHDLIRRFKKKGLSPIYLDGDEIRNLIPHIGFDDESRKKHNLSIGLMASIFEKQGNVVIVSLISPYREIREEIRNICGNFIEVYISTDFETCKNRDTKGLYKKAIAGEIDNFTGFNSPYEIPFSPEIVINTANLDLQSCSKKIYEYYKKN